MIASEAREETLYIYAISGGHDRFIGTKDSRLARVNGCFRDDPLLGRFRVALCLT